MKKNIAVIFPGQGSQYTAMGLDFFESRRAAREVFEEANDILNENFDKIIFKSSAEALSQTDVSQPAIYITSCAIYRALYEEFGGLDVKYMAGLSLGEYTALAMSERITFEQGLRLVKARGEFMQQASLKNPGTLMVVLGLESDLVFDILKPFQNQGMQIWVANLNCPGQVVVAGEKAAFHIVEVVLKAKGAKRILPLEVSGAFHSPLMQSAEEKLRPLIDAAHFQSSNIEFLSNVSGGFVDNLDKVKENLAAQVSSTTYWQKEIEAIDKAGTDLYLEIGPGKTLSGMNRKIGVKAPTVSIDKIADMAMLEEMMSRSCEGI